MPRVFCATLGIAVMGAGAIVVFAGSWAKASVITSNDFTFGIGATGNGSNVWTTDRKRFKQLAHDAGILHVLARRRPRQEGGPKQDVPLRTERSHRAEAAESPAIPADAGFGVPIVASYTGPAPSDADPINPNYQLTLEITGISVLYWRLYRSRRSWVNL